MVLQPVERHSKRVVFYVTPTARDRLTHAVDASGVTQADWLRAAMELALKGPRFDEDIGDAQGDTDSRAAPEEVAVYQTKILTLEGDVRTLSAEKEGLERLIQQHRERQGMSDSLNQELTKTIDRITLILPAPSSDANRPWWRLW